MAQKSEVFVIAFRSVDNSVKYAGLDSRDSFVKSENPSSLKKCFTKEQAVELVKTIRLKGLEEGVTIRVKSLKQSIRDYAWQIIQAVNETTVADADTLGKVLKRFEVKKDDTSKKKEETPAEEKVAETTEE